MIIKHILAAAIATAAAVLVVPADAASFKEETPYSQSAFAAAQKAGEPILVHVTASWCSTCAAQKPIIEKLRADPQFKNLRIFNVDFDAQKALLRRLDVRMQSTLIVYKGAEEEGRSSGDTDPRRIAALVAKAE